MRTVYGVMLRGDRAEPSVYYCPKVSQYEVFAMELHGRREDAERAAVRAQGHLLATPGREGWQAVVVEVSIRQVGHVSASVQVVGTEPGGRSGEEGVTTYPPGAMPMAAHVVGSPPKPDQPGDAE